MLFPNQDTWLLALATALAMLAAVFDLRTERIPNWMTGSGLLAGLLLRLGTGGWRGLAGALAAAILAGGALFLFFALGGMGGGDVKLMAAVASLAGLTQLGSLLLLTALLGGVVALASAVCHRSLRSAVSNTVRLVPLRPGAVARLSAASPEAKPLTIPYAVAIAGGTLATLANVLMIR